MVRLCSPRAALAECLNTRSLPSLVPYAMPPPCTVQHGKHQNLCQDSKSGPGALSSLQGNVLLFTHSQVSIRSNAKAPRVSSVWTATLSNETKLHKEN